MHVWDAESEKRVARHREMRREKRFETLECPLRLDELDVPERGVILLEDMGNLVANELYDSEGAGQDAGAGDFARRRKSASPREAISLLYPTRSFAGARIMRAIRMPICLRWRG